jgi:ribonuclease BN (tRNA processing enzyme)
MKSKSDNYLKFLGTAGARYVVAKQLRYSGGIFLHLQGKNIVLDPGPGTLVRLAKSRPAIDVTRLDAVVLTHIHIDHSNDVNVVIDAMTSGGHHRHGSLFAPDECINGPDRVVLRYVRDFLDEIRVLRPQAHYRLGGLSFATSLRHDHPAETYGIVFDLDGLKVSVMADTRYFPELLKSYRGTDVLVMNVVFYEPHAGIAHLSLDDVRTIVRALRPRQTFLTHLGMSMVTVRPRELTVQLSEELGCPVTVATDGLTVPLG